MRPHIICHMVSSIDGKLHPSRFSAPAAGVDPKVLRGHYETVTDRFYMDGWIVGRVTMAEIVKDEREPVVDEGHPDLREDWINPDCGKPLAIGIDPQGKLHYSGPILNGDHLVAVLGGGVADSYLAELRERGVSYVFAGPDGRDMAGAVSAIQEHFGANTLLLEGGGAINAAFLEAGLIDEISVLLYPALDGVAGIQSIFEGPPTEAGNRGYGQALRFKSSEVLEGGMVWLRYDMSKADAQS